MREPKTRRRKSTVHPARAACTPFMRARKCVCGTGIGALSLTADVPCALHCVCPRGEGNRRKEARTQRRLRGVDGQATWRLADQRPCPAQETREINVGAGTSVRFHKEKAHARGASWAVWGGQGMRGPSALCGRMSVRAQTCTTIARHPAQALP